MREFGAVAQAVIQHRRFRRIFNRSDSTNLFAMLADPSHNFRRSFTRTFVGAALHKPSDGNERLYLNVGHTGLNEPGFRDWTRSARARPVYLIHDIIPITHPEYSRAGERSRHIERMETALQTASGIIVNSKSTLRELEAFASTRRLSLPNSVAALLGSDALPLTVGVRPPPERPTFVILGTIEARKNHLLLLQAWTRIVERLAGDAPLLLVIGQRGWECEQTLDLLDRSEMLKGSVVEISNCCDESLANHLASARALLFPSLVEGYGLPLVEALRSGTPVIASDLPVFREIAGKIPEYLDPIDGPAWAQTIKNYAASDSVAREAQLRRMARFHAPSWDDHFAKVRTWLSTL
jgi:glycosyltransferase involved in cell wall biosynthesis